MKRIFLLLMGLFLLALPLISISCITETDYESDESTFKIPWGEKMGTRNPEEAEDYIPSQDSAG